MDAAVLVRGRLFLENVKITDLQLVVFVGMISDAQVNFGPNKQKNEGIQLKENQVFSYII